MKRGLLVVGKGNLPTDFRNTVCVCVFFTFMGPCIVNVFKQDQLEATLRNGIYYYKCCT